MSAAGPALRVASFNIRTSRGWDGRDRWRRRRRACLDAIAGLGADVIGLQEVRPRQLVALRARFPGAVTSGDGRDRDRGGEHAAVLVLGGGWVVESACTRWLSPTPDVAGSVGWDAALPRVATLVRLRRGERRLGFVNTHLDHAGPLARKEGAAAIAAWTAAEPDLPWVLLGDLNDAPGSPPWRVFVDAGFADVLPHDAGGTEHAFTGSTGRRRIDHVLVGPGVRVLGAAVVHPRPHGRLPSDHWPVVADVALT